MDFAIYGVTNENFEPDQNIQNCDGFTVAMCLANQNQIPEP